MSDRRMLRPLVGLVLSIVCFAPGAGAAVREWTAIGPFGGAPDLVAFHPADPAVVYAAGTAGLYISEDAGATWRLARPSVNREVITQLAVSAKPPYPVFVIESGYDIESGRYYASLQQLRQDGSCCGAPPTDIVASGPMTIVRGDPEVLLIWRAGQLLRKSLTAGSRWEYTTLGSYGPEFLEVAGDESGYVFAWKVWEKTAMRSADRGLTWTTLALPMPPNGMRHHQDGIVYLTGFGAGGLCAGPSNGLFQSWDFGNAWYLANVGLSANDRDCYATTSWIECVRGGTCYLEGDGKVFSRGPGEVRWVLRPGFPAGRMWVRSDGALLLGKAAGKLTRSAGDVWAPASGFSEVLVSGLLVDENRTLRFAAVAEMSRLFERVEGGDWQEIPFTVDPSTAVLSGGAVIVRRAEGDWVVREAGASSWTAVPGTSAMVALTRVPGGPWLALQKNGWDYRFQTSSDGGKSWATLGKMTSEWISDFSYRIHPDPASAQHLLLEFQRDLLESKDGGKSWTTILDANFNEVRVDWRGATLYSRIGSRLSSRPMAGGEWKQVGSGFAFAVEGRTGALFVVSGEGVLRSQDGGATWTTLAPPPGFYPTSLEATEDGLVAGSYTGVQQFEYPGPRRRAVRK